MTFSTGDAIRLLTAPAYAKLKILREFKDGIDAFAKEIEHYRIP